MDLYATSQPYLFIAVLIFWITLSFTSTKWFLFMTGMVVPLMVPRMDIGIGLDWAKIVGPLALALLVIRRRPASFLLPRELSPFIVYAVLVTTIWMVAEYSVLHRYLGAQAMGLATMQSYYKMPVQLASFLGQVLTLFIVPTRATNRKEALAAVSGFGTGVIVSFLFGVGLYFTTGQGMLGRKGVGFVQIEGLGFWRIGGLSGEPKFLGIVLATLAVWELAGLVFAKGRRIRLAIVMGALFLTLSTSAWAAAVVGGVAVLVMSMRRPTRVNWGEWSIIGAAAVTVVFAGSVVGAVFSERFTERLFGEKSEVARQKDALVFDAFREDPVNLLWGFGLGGGDLAVIPYVPPEELVYQRTPTPGVTGARVLGDLGFIGIALLVGAAWRWSKVLQKRGHLQGAAFAIGGLFAVFFGSLLALSGYFLVMGAVLTASQYNRPAGPHIGGIQPRVAASRLAPT